MDSSNAVHRPGGSGIPDRSIIMRVFKPIDPKTTTVRVLRSYAPRGSLISDQTMTVAEMVSGRWLDTSHGTIQVSAEVQFAEGPIATASVERRGSKFFAVRNLADVWNADGSMNHDATQSAIDAALNAGWRL